MFQDLLPDQQSLNALNDLLNAAKIEYIFEQERMIKFVELLGFSNALSIYEYLQSGDREGIKGWRQFVHIPDLTPEKNAKRAAQARIKVPRTGISGSPIGAGH